jgi:replicative DNA helicase
MKLKVKTISDLNNDFASKTDSIITVNFIDFDRVVNGFRKGELTCIGGRPAMGKTSFITQLAIDISKAYNVFYWSLSESSSNLYSYILARESNIPRLNLFKNDLNHEQADKISLGLKRIESSSIKFIHHQFYTDKVIEVIKSELNTKKIDILFIDYLQLLDTTLTYNSINERITACLLALKTFAQKENIAIVITSQLSGDFESYGGSKRPRLCDIQNSTDSEHIFDSILLLYRPEYYDITEDEHGNSNTNKMEINVIKNNKGKTGTFALEYSPNRSEFTDWKHQGFFNTFS